MAAARQIPKVRRPTFVFVSHTGTVHPSGFLPVAAGSLRTQRLAEVYRESPLFRKLRDFSELAGRCGRCEFAHVCGGSRSRALAMNGGPLADDPLCAYVPGSFPFQAEVADMLRSPRAHASSMAAS